MPKYKVALLSVFSPEVLVQIQSHLPEGFEMTAVKTHGKTYDDQERLDAVSDADFILFGGSDKLTGKHIDSAPKLKLIQKWGIGYDKIDIKAAAERGIPVALTAGANAIPVAEHAVMLMLATYRRLPYVDRNLRQGVWLKAEMRAISYQLNGKTVGVVGLGHIGREVVKRVQAFGARVVYYTRTRRTAEVEQRLGVEYRPLDDLFAEADVISLHVPLFPETRKLVDARAFSLMKPTAIIVNTARGEVIDEPAMVEALRSGRILGAGLDVFAVEPAGPGNPLYEMDNVVVMPHAAGNVIDNVANMARRAFGNMVRVANGEPLPEADVVHA